MALEQGDSAIWSKECLVLGKTFLEDFPADDLGLCGIHPGDFDSDPGASALAPDAASFPVYVPLIE